MAQNLSDFDKALKNTYGPGLRNALNNSNPILTEAVRDEDSVQGRKFIWSVHTGRSNSTGARAEYATLPTADRQKYIGPEDTLAYLYHTIEVTGQAIHLTRGDAGAFTRALESEIRGAEVDVKNDLARQMFNEAVTINSALANGSIARINGAPSANVITVNDNDGSSTLPSSVMRHFFVGMLIDSVTPATGAISEAAMEITAISVANRTITVDDDGSAADNDFLFRAGNYASGENEINGLRFLIGSQNYAGVTVSSNPSWAAQTDGSATAGISEVLIERAAQKVETDGNGSTPTLFITEQVQERKLASSLQAQKRYDGRQTTLTAGWRGLDLARGTLVTDRYCPSNKIFALTPSELAWAVGLDWQWDTDDKGGVLWKHQTKDAVMGRFKAYVNLETYTRNAHAVITVVEPTDV